MGLLVISILLCGGVMLIEWSLAKHPGIEHWMLTVSSVLGPLGLFLMLPVLLYFAVGTFLLGIFLCCLPRSSPWLIRTGLLVVTAVSTGISGAEAYNTQRQETLRTQQKVEALRQKYPKASLQERLAYEKHASSNTIRLSGKTPRILSAQVETQLRDDQPYQQLDHSPRNMVLETLHSQYAADFVNVRTFGVGRMGYLGYYMLEVPPAPPIRFPQPQKLSESLPLPDVALHSPLAPPLSGNLQGLHNQSKYDFLNPNRMGLVENVNSVAGFIPHHFSQAPSLDYNTQTRTTSPSRWIVTRVNLIGILKSEKPRVYVTDEFPDMAKLENIPVRELDAFETASLARLREKEDVVTQEHPVRIRMVGSLRAGETCLRCHSVDRGELLGAFTYEIEPAIQVMKPEKKETGALLKKRTLLLSVGRM